MFHEHESQSQSNRLKIEHFCFSVCGGNSDTCPQEANLSQKNQQKKNGGGPQCLIRIHPHTAPTQPRPTRRSSTPLSRSLRLSASSLLLPLPATPHLLLSSRRLEPGALLPRVATGGSASPPLASSPLPWGHGRARRWQAAAARYPRSGVLDPGEVVVAWFPNGGALFYGFSSFRFSPFLWILICDELAANPWVGLRIRWCEYVMNCFFFLQFFHR